MHPLFFPYSFSKTKAITPYKTKKELHAAVPHGVRDWSRTNGVSLRRRTLYPTEVHGHKYLLHYFYSLIILFN